MKKTMDSGSRPLSAVYMRDFFIGGGATWLSLPPSIHKGGVRSAIFYDTVAALFKGGGKHNHGSLFCSLDQ